MMEDRFSSAPGNGQTSDTGTPLVEQAKQQTQQMMEQTQQKVAEVAGQAGQQMKSQLASQKEQAAGSLDSAAQALHQTGQQLRDQGQGILGQYADTAAEQLQRVSGYLHGREIDQLVRETEDFARSRPALFLGGAFALGILTARFLKSSARSTGAAPGSDMAMIAPSPPMGISPALAE